MKATKNGFIQIRVTAEEKRAIRNSARKAGMRMSRWMLSKALPERSYRFWDILKNLEKGQDRKFALAELNDFLTRLPPHEFEPATAEFPSGVHLSAADSNYVAAMVEYAAARINVPPPDWTGAVIPPEEPVFGTDLKSVRLHLLVHSPLPFRKRNIFIDASLGDRV
jgi:hypothetical protein